MRRNFTVYGLRFSKTIFGTRINTGFPDPAVATVLTACGIETNFHSTKLQKSFGLQQCLPLAVLKLVQDIYTTQQMLNVATVLTACGIETYLP